MTRIISIVSLTVTFFLSLAVYSQTPEKKLTPEEAQKLEKFTGSFMKSYYETLDLTEVSASFFARDYKKRNALPFFINTFDASLTEDEKFQNYFMLLNLFYLAMITKLDENNYDLKKTFDAGKTNDDNEFFGKRFLSIFQKYPKAQLFLYKEDFSQIKNVEDFCASIQEFKCAVQELRESITPEKKAKFLKFLAENKDKLDFKEFNYSFECSKDNCERLPEKTKIFHYAVLPFEFLITKDNDKLKIIRVMPLTD